VPYMFVTGDSGEIQDRMPNAMILQKPFTAARLAQALRSVAPLAEQVYATPIWLEPLHVGATAAPAAGLDASQRPDW
jgi:hypothetical protein